MITIITLWPHPCHPWCRQFPPQSHQVPWLSGLRQCQLHRWREDRSIRECFYATFKSEMCIGHGITFQSFSSNPTTTISVAGTWLHGQALSPPAWSWLAEWAPCRRWRKELPRKLPMCVQSSLSQPLFIQPHQNQVVYIPGQTSALDEVGKHMWHR